MKKKAPSLAEVSPYKSVAEELQDLRRTFQSVCERYAERIDSEIAGVLERVVVAGTRASTETTAEVAGKLAPSKPNAATRNKQARMLTQVHELRDMLALLRTLQIKPAEGRRKDLKKVESVVADLRQLVEGWS